MGTEGRLQVAVDEVKSGRFRKALDTLGPIYRRDYGLPPTL